MSLETMTLTLTGANVFGGSGTDDDPYLYCIDPTNSVVEVDIWLGGECNGCTDDDGTSWEFGPLADITLTLGDGTNTTPITPSLIGIDSSAYDLTGSASFDFDALVRPPSPDTPTLPNLDPWSRTWTDPDTGAIYQYTPNGVIYSYIPFGVSTINPDGSRTTTSGSQSPSAKVRFLIPTP